MDTKQGLTDLLHEDWIPEELRNITVEKEKSWTSFSTSKFNLLDDSDNNGDSSDGDGNNDFGGEDGEDEMDTQSGDDEAEPDTMMQDVRDIWGWDDLTMNIYHWPRKPTGESEEVAAKDTKPATSVEYKGRMKRTFKIQKKKTLKDLLLVSKMQFGLPAETLTSNLRLRLYTPEYDLPEKPYFEDQLEKSLIVLDMEASWINSYLLEVSSHMTSFEILTTLFCSKHARLRRTRMNGLTGILVLLLYVTPNGSPRRRKILQIRNLRRLKARIRQTGQRKEEEKTRRRVNRIPRWSKMPSLQGSLQPSGTPS